MRKCNGCRFCCWSFDVSDVPSVIGFEVKIHNSHCSFECEKGCSIHELAKQPKTCIDFKCAYLQGKKIHRPDAFQEVLEEMKITMGNFIPAVNEKIDWDEAVQVIKETRTIPADIYAGGIKEIILPLDKEKDGSWMTTQERIEKWESLYNKYGIDLPKSAKEFYNTIFISP